MHDQTLCAGINKIEKQVGPSPGLLICVEYKAAQLQCRNSRCSLAIMFFVHGQFQH